MGRFPRRLLSHRTPAGTRVLAVAGAAVLVMAVAGTALATRDPVRPQLRETGSGNGTVVRLSLAPGTGSGADGRRRGNRAGGPSLPAAGPRVDVDAVCGAALISVTCWGS